MIEDKVKNWFVYLSEICIDFRIDCFCKFQSTFYLRRTSKWIDLLKKWNWKNDLKEDRTHISKDHTPILVTIMHNFFFFLLISVFSETLYFAATRLNIWIFSVIFRNESLSEKIHNFRYILSIISIFGN